MDIDFLGLKTFNNGSARTSCRYCSLPPYRAAVPPYRTDEGYGGERVADILCLPPYDKPLLLSLLSNFTRKPAITLAVVNILINYRQSGCGSDGSMWKTQQLIKPRSRVGDVTSLAEPRTAVLGVQ